MWNKINKLWESRRSLQTETQYNPNNIKGGFLPIRVAQVNVPVLFRNGKKIVQDGGEMGKEGKTIGMDREV